MNSWKEIAHYLDRGVRTVQRWERQLALPVRRPRGRMRSAVIALADELDQWLLKTPKSHLTESGDSHHQGAAQAPLPAKNFDRTAASSGPSSIAERGTG
ncbi:MAG: hypothetical protein JO187_09240 [Acidobacteria bacterium]|nr:hypothetical protein [Acidobacteriaceae bacterium]MBV9609728.1 hypothetical protein [Acidobacteriota bacterium]